MRPCRLVLLGLLEASLVAGSAHAADVPGERLCDNPYETAPLCDSDGDLLLVPELGYPPRRFVAVRAALAGMLSWPAPVEGRGAGGIRVMISPYLPFDAPWLDWHVLAGGYLGSWGDDRHGGVTIETGLGARLRFPPLGFYAFGPMINASALYSTAEDRIGFRTDIGLAGELDRAIGLELAFTALVSDFEVAGQSRFSSPGASAAIWFDFCALSTQGCAYDPRSAELDDRTCAIYQRANQQCAARARRSSRREERDLCAAIEGGLDTYANPALEYDPVHTMLEYAEAHSAGQAQADLAALLEVHERWTRWLADGASARLAAARANESLGVDRRYAPYPVELARALGCADATGCEDVCDD